jgi:hypothetical protein
LDTLKIPEENKMRNRRMPKWILAAIITLLCGVAAAAQAAVSGDFEYTLNADDGVTITRYKGKGPAGVVIPGEIEGKKVTEIGEGAFRNQSRFVSDKLTSVTIPPTVRVIGKDAFYNNDLRNVTIPESVREIGKKAFNAFSGYIALDKRGGTYTRQGNSFFHDGKALPRYAIILPSGDIIFESIDGASPDQYEKGGSICLPPGNHTFVVKYYSKRSDGTIVYSTGSSTLSYNNLEARAYRLIGSDSGGGTVSYELQYELMPE